MSDWTRLTTVETVYENRSWLFTVRDQYGEPDEAILVPCEDGVEHGSTNSRPGADDGVEAWINRCTHEAQRFDTGRGVAMRDGQLICPKHGSMFDACSGYCDNGEAADTTLPSVDISVDDGVVYLTDDDLTFAHAGGIDDGDDENDDDGPASTSHIGF
ncbi:Rieske (2Fe-2S) protein [Natrinema longum]|uniref:Rieske 2Fe-2S domain-containing protein n=1 Tax=Natrinema longum TaxID=370324 RepID=A0A8A2U670_9EURY|nr:Rieske 2Fe-2S domain-containing protein [Natrinema longum]MBZ6494542.1 Rieske 2Fe-2S domain-containing protein [Natrinema longum]QSW84137.1 Rieske 2Fe-2S domain-containing protein [Natrinema longum]